MRICEFSYKFWVVLFTFLVIIIVAPFRIWFTYNLNNWYKAAKEEEDEDIVYQN